MKISKAQRVLLLFAGAVGALIGAAILLVPVAFYASGNGIILGSDPSLLSEVRAPGGALLACSLLIVAGAFSEPLTFTSTLVGAALYSSYGFARILSVALDGLPTTALLVAGAAEVALGLACAWVLRSQRYFRSWKWSA
jgi:hypothetical protein